MSKIAKIIKVSGLVQGVGFRPFVYKLALEYNLNGWVENRNDGVLIKIEGEKKDCENFSNTFKQKAPPASNIVSIKTEDSILEYFSDFKIVKSENISTEITEVSPDIGVCQDCLNDMQTQDYRIGYPFINCTNCGPRFTIIKDLPYDREKTTMQAFEMCDNCRKEYEDIMDRRFHAQPVACSICGPEYELVMNGERTRDLNQILEIASTLINQGKIVSIKGLGGFFMACDATNQEAVKQLRSKKNREGKPFAVMFSDIEALKEFTEVNKSEEQNLLSWRRPIVLLKQKKQLAYDVSVGFDTLGAMLPYMPIHYLLFEKLKTPSIVLTSGNISEEPIIISNDQAEERLSKVSDAILINNRDIYNRVDDSVEINIRGEERLIRRSRGFVPNPVEMNLEVDGIFAAGAELVNCFCIGKGNQAILSQHIGDLKNIETFEFYSESVERFKKLFRVEPKYVVHDLHPDYFSSRYAQEMNLETIQVQHHHAHIASCMAEYGLDEKVIGVSFDGTGLGTDNNIWGGEFLIADLNDFQRFTHFDYIPLPGGDKVTQEPWRTGISYLYKYFGKDFLKLELPFLDKIEDEKIEFILSAIDKNINCPLSSSAGRLFDTVAALINLCPVSGFHAEAPMRLEAEMDNDCEQRYDFEIAETISFEKTITGIVNDIKSDKKNSLISAKFHNTIIYCIFAVAERIRNKHKINKIVLSGGSFQNRYILENVEKLLIENDFEVFSHKKIPSNDGGIALGQIAIAAKKVKISLSDITD